MLSYRLQSIKYQNKFKIAPGETIEQEFLFNNDGQVSWPEDTYFIYTGSSNTLNLPEEIKIG